jgi:2-dehydro-3-deoxygluconokinase
MPELLQYCDVVMGNIWAAEQLLEISTPIKESKYKSHEELIDASIQSINQLRILYPEVTTISYNFRLEDSYFGILQQGNERKISKIFSLENTIDKVGSGDCFMSGLIYGLLNDYKLQDTINFAASAAVGKLYEKGDATNQTIQSIKNNLV